MKNSATFEEMLKLQKTDSCVQVHFHMIADTVLGIN